MVDVSAQTDWPFVGIKCRMTQIDNVVNSTCLIDKGSFDGQDEGASFQ